jgi:F0F1-type ATP synthase assembly protein I
VRRFTSGHDREVESDAKAAAPPKQEPELATATKVGSVVATPGEQSSIARRLAAKAVALPTAEAGADDRHRERRALHNGFGDALSQAFEFAVTPILFALFGLWLDNWLGTGHLWVVVLSVLGITGVCIKTIYRYKEKVEREEEGKPWTRRQR